MSGPQYAYNLKSLKLRAGHKKELLLINTGINNKYIPNFIIIIFFGK